MRSPLALIEADGVVPEGLAEITDRRTEVEALCREVADLPPQQRDALVLREFYGLSYEESAAALGVSLAALESLIHRGRERLKERIRPSRAAHAALTVPLALWDSLAAALPGFDPAGKASGLAGALAKLASAPVAAKLAATTAAVTVGVGAVGVSTVREAEARPERVAAPASSIVATPKTSVERLVADARDARVESRAGTADGQPSRPGAGSLEKDDDPEDGADEGEDLSDEPDDDDDRAGDVDDDEREDDGEADAGGDDDGPGFSDETESDDAADERDESDDDVSEHE